MDGWLKIISVVLIAVAVTAGCISQEGSVTASQIKVNTLQSIEDVKTYTASISGTIKSTTTNETGTFTTTGSITGNGVVDLANKRLKMEQIMTTLGQAEVISAFYIVDDIVYMKTETQGNVTWMKRNITNADRTWASYDNMERQAELLEMSDVERLDDEVINGVDCYVLSITPDLEKYYEIMTGQNGTDGTEINHSDFISEWSIKHGIAKDTHFIMKAYNQITINMSLLFGESIYISDQEFYILYNNYNTDVAIELPEEAGNAPWWPEHAYP